MHTITVTHGTAIFLMGPVFSLTFQTNTVHTKPDKSDCWIRAMEQAGFVQTGMSRSHIL